MAVGAAEEMVRLARGVPSTSTGSVGIAVGATEVMVGMAAEVRMYYTIGWLTRYFTRVREPD